MLSKTNSQQAVLLGKIISIEEIENAFRFKTENGFVEIVDYGNNVVRVSTQFYQEPEYFSYSVIQKNKKWGYIIDSQKDEYILNGNSFNIHLSKKNSAISFINKNKQAILMDEPFLTTACIGTEITSFKKLQQNEQFVGLGEKTGNLSRKGKYFVHKNSDTFAYGTEQDPIYSSIPFYIGIHNQLVYGVFVDTSYTTAFDFGVSTNRYHNFSTENGPLHYYFIDGQNISEIIEKYTALTGRTPMPPSWAIGFHQSRYSYYPEFKVDEIIKGFEDRNIPLDALHFDIHYMDKFKAFTFDKKKFPDPKKTIQTLAKKGVHVVPILDPGIKKEIGYFPYEDGLKNNAFVKYIDGQIYEGGVWPGNCYFPDFTNPKVRKWWIKLCAYYTDLGIDGLWNDMNEPAVWGQVFPTYTNFNFDNKPTTFKQARNVYGLLMSLATLEGLQEKDNKKRYFVLTRAAFAGIQRISTKWTGDNIASDEHLLLGVRLVNSLGLSGVGFAGTDVGGFVANTDSKLYIRWIALGCFTPFFRAHKMINANSSEPWSFGEEAEQIATNFIRLRYRLFPYLYAHFFQMYQTGLPINKAMPINYPHEEWVFKTEFQNQFLFGDAFLVCPIDSKTQYCKSHLPMGNWFDFYSDTIFEGDKDYLLPTNVESIPVFVKSGKIICMQEPSKNLDPKSLPQILEVHVYSNNEDAEGFYYEDNCINTEYKSGKYLFQKIIFYAQKNTLSIQNIHQQFKSKRKQIRLFIHGKSHQNKINIELPNKKFSLNLKKQLYTILEPIPNFDPFVNQEIGRKEVPVLSVNFAI